MQKYMPEGYNQSMCENYEKLLKAYENNVKIKAKAISINPNTGELLLQITEDNLIKGIIKFDKITFAESSLVGSYINCSFVNKPTKNEFCLFTRDCKEAEQYCIKNYKPGDKIIGKVLTFLAYGTMLDIGGGYCALLPNQKVFDGIKHGTQLLKRNSFINVVINENDGKKINIKIE